MSTPAAAHHSWPALEQRVVGSDDAYTTHPARSESQTLSEDWTMSNTVLGTAISASITTLGIIVAIIMNHRRKG
jgi:hypothetical protein